jgi:hypothetical protein
MLHQKAAVIARSEATKQSILSLRGGMDCFASLAMTDAMNPSDSIFKRRRSPDERCDIRQRSQHGPGRR